MVSPITGGSYFYFNTDYSIKPLPPGTTANSGEVCGQTGVWKSETYKVVTGVTKGEVMPQYQGRDVEWELTGHSLSELDQPTE